MQSALQMQCRQGTALVLHLHLPLKIDNLQEQCVSKAYNLQSIFPPHC